MENFLYNTPTRVYFGKGTENQVGQLVKEQKCKKVLVHYGSGSVIRSGLLDRVKKSLDEAGIAYVELGGVVPNPHLSKVYEGIDLCRKEGVDFILAVGGGSVIDSAKAIGYGLANEGDVWDFYAFKRVPTACAPVGVILTLAATGSEMSNSSVITKEDGGIKRGCNTEYGRPRFAIMNPELTMTLPPYQTAAGASDIMMHTMERYLCKTDPTLELTDGIAEHLLRVVMKNARILVDDPANYQARAEVMWAGSLSHNGLTGCGTDGGGWESHRLEHELSGMFDVTHGAGLTAIWGSWARYAIDCRPARFAQLAINVAGVKAPEGYELGKDAACDKEIGLKGIAAMEDFFRSINMPVNMKELGIDPTDAQIDELADKCWKACTDGNKTSLGSIRPLLRDDMKAIYEMARG